MSQARRLPGRRRAARHDIDDPPPAAPPQTAAAVRLAGLPVGEVYDDPPNEAGSPAQRRPAEHAAAQGVVCGQHRRFLRAADGAFDDLAGDPWRSGGVPMLACTAEEIARDILIEQARDLMPFGQNRTALARSGRRRCRCRPGGAAGRPPPWRWPASPPYGRSVARSGSRRRGNGRYRGSVAASARHTSTASCPGGQGRRRAPAAARGDKTRSTRAEARRRGDAGSVPASRRSTTSQGSAPANAGAGRCRAVLPSHARAHRRGGDRPAGRRRGRAR